MTTIGFADRVVMQTLLQPIKLEMGLSDTQLSLPGGLTFAALNVPLGIPIAQLAERRMRVAIIAIGVALWSAATMRCGGVRRFVGFVFARIGEAAGQPATVSLISDYFRRDRRTSAIGILNIAVPLGVRRRRRRWLDRPSLRLADRLPGFRSTRPATRIAALFHCP